MDGPARGEAILDGQKVDDNIVLVGKTSGGSPMRWTFSEIKPTSFRWRGESMAGKDWRVFQDLWARRTQLYLPQH